MVWLGMVGRVVLGVGRVLGLGVVMMGVRPVVVVVVVAVIVVVAAIVGGNGGWRAVGMVVVIGRELWCGDACYRHWRKHQSTRLLKESVDNVFLMN